MADIELLTSTINLMREENQKRFDALSQQLKAIETRCNTLQNKLKEGKPNAGHNENPLD